MLLKFWISVSDKEQEDRFQSRAKDPMRRWKLSPMDLESRTRWVEYSKAKDLMIEHTDIPEARWRQMEGDDKRRARLNVIREILEAIPYREVIPGVMELGPRPPRDRHYVRPPRDHQYIIHDAYEDLTHESV